MVAAVILVAVLIGAVRVWPQRLSPDEEAFVGTWCILPRDSSDDVVTLRLGRDHRCIHSNYWIIEVGRWYVTDGRLYMDYEPSAIRRAFRPVLDRAGIAVRPVGSLDKADFNFSGKASADRGYVRVAAK
jgi:hypothetical protein